MSEAMRLFGTDEPARRSERLRIGALSFTLEDGTLRHVRVGETEVLRAISFLVRDRDWGTLVPEIREVSRSLDDRLEMVLEAIFTNGASDLVVTLTIVADSRHLSVTATVRIRGNFETNRTGFTVLHPAGLAGCPVQVRHATGRVEVSRFPELIDPWQPFMNLTGISHQQNGLAVTCEFRGDIFEMEDQRQWGDASYKTYSRPLALPWPYVLSDGETLTQGVDLRWTTTHANVQAAAPGPESTGTTFPETAIVLSAGDALRLADEPGDFAVAGASRILCHVDTEAAAPDEQIAAFAGLQRALPDPAYDLELVCAFRDAPAPELDRIAELVRTLGLSPASVFVCPSVDRYSTPPGSAWPECPPLEEIHSASARAFPDLPRGGGMASFFPELNRKRPPVWMLDFVSHGLCPIVHAADDLSVMESLEAIPHLTRSARSIFGGAEYRIGPATIAMRQNPYGARSMPNPEGRRICMADDDPRHRAAFGAAYALGLATALAPAGISVWTPAALYGPRGLIRDGREWPLAAVLRSLAPLAGQDVHAARIVDGVATLSVGDARFAANLTGQPISGLAAYDWRMTLGTDGPR